MRLAVLSDAHGNPEGLTACLRAIERLDVSRIHFLGDAVGYLNGEAPVLDALEAVGAYCQKGNHEAMLLGEIAVPEERVRVYGIDRLRERVDAATLERLRAWPEHRELEQDGHRILFAHGSPTPSITEYVYPDTELRLPEPFEYRAVFLGHTHRPFARSVGDVTVVNVGSCGMPRDQGDLASFALYDTERREATVYRVRFDVQAVLERWCEGAPEPVIRVLSRQTDQPVGVLLSP